MRWRSDFGAWRERRLWQERYQAHRLRQLRGVLGALGGKMVLELGCGMGGLAVALARQGSRVIALDPNQSYCRVCVLRAARYGLHLPLVTAAGERLPFRDGSFELVTCLDVLEHANSLDQTLSEIARVLRPNGRGIITATNRFAFRDPHFHLRGINWLPRRWAGPVIRWRNRVKRGARFEDRQALDTMHYVTWGDLLRRCTALEFQVVDLREEQVRGGALPPDTRFRRTILLARRLKLAVAGYRVYRAFFLGTFEALVIKCEMGR